MAEFPFYPLVVGKNIDKEAIRRRIEYAWGEFVPRVRDMRVPKGYECNNCKLKNLCNNCAAYSYITKGRYTEKVEYMCEVARKKELMINSLLYAK